jgi:hypothetical protein
MALFSSTISPVETVSYPWRGGMMRRKTTQCPGLLCTWYVCRSLVDEHGMLAIVHVSVSALSIIVLKFNANVPKVGSKLDKASSRAVKYEEGEALATKHGSHFCEASAKTRENVRKPFVDVVDQIVKSPHLKESASRQIRGSVLVGGGIPEPSGCSC